MSDRKYFLLVDEPNLFLRSLCELFFEEGS